MSFNFKVENDELINSQYPEGLNDLTVLIDITGGLMNYGEFEQVNTIFKKLEQVCSRIDDEERKVDKELVLIRFNDLNLSLKDKARFMNYMINYSLCGSKVKSLLEQDSEELIAWLNELEIA